MPSTEERLRACARLKPSTAWSGGLGYLVNQKPKPGAGYPRPLLTPDRYILDLQFKIHLACKSRSTLFTPLRSHPAVTARFHVARGTVLPYSSTASTLAFDKRSAATMSLCPAPAAWHGRRPGRRRSAAFRRVRGEAGWFGGPMSTYSDSSQGLLSCELL